MYPEGVKPSGYCYTVGKTVCMYREMIRMRHFSRLLLLLMCSEVKILKRVLFFGQVF